MLEKQFFRFYLTLIQQLSNKNMNLGLKSCDIFHLIHGRAVTFLAKPSEYLFLPDYDSY
jgi:hypothetical protein